MYKILGWVNISLFLIITAPYWMRKLNNYIFSFKGRAYRQLIKVLRTIHKPLGILLAVSAAVHGYLALGSLRLHTGTLAWVMILITVSLGGTFYSTRKTAVFTWHKVAALILAVLILAHLIVPNAVYLIFS